MTHDVNRVDYNILSDNGFTDSSNQDKDTGESSETDNDDTPDTSSRYSLVLIEKIKPNEIGKIMMAKR